MSDYSEDEDYGLEYSDDPGSDPNVQLENQYYVYASHPDSVPNEHPNSKNIPGNGQMARDSIELAQSSANLGTPFVKQEIEECYCPTAVKTDQNDVEITASMADANIGTVTVKEEPISLMTEEYQAPVIQPTTSTEPKKRRRKRPRKVNNQSILEKRQLKRPKNKERYVENLAECPEYRGSVTTLPAAPAPDVSAHSDLCSSTANHGSANNSNEEQNRDRQAPINEIDRNPSTSTLDGPSEPANKMKIAKIGIDICYGTAFFITSDGQKYDDRLLCEYVSILRESEADDLGCKAHIVFPVTFGHILSKAELRAQSVIGYRKKFEQFSKDAHSISRLWENGRISVELHQYWANAQEILFIYDLCAELFGLDRSILKCNVLEINWLDRWPFSVIANVAHHCKQLIFKPQKCHQLHLTFLDIMYTTTLPQHVDVTLDLINAYEYDFIDELENRFRRSNAQYFKFNLRYPSFPRNKLLRNYYGTLEMTKVASQCAGSGLCVDTVIIEQCPHTSATEQ